MANNPANAYPETRIKSVSNPYQVRIKSDWSRR